MLEPFLKWAGGKRWLVHSYPDIVPRKYNTYYEPFVGSGALFFQLQPEKAVLSDNNAELINAFRQVRDNPERIESLLLKYQDLHNSGFYYAMRAKQPRDPVLRAARFIYLNRTCFNGLYRVNERGKFNVPIGTKTQVAFEAGFLVEVSSTLRNASLRVCDFEVTIAKAGRGDLLYIDPPYTVMHNNNNFIKYNAVLFSWKDQLRLANAAMQAARRGALILLSNADHECIRRIYSRFGTHHRLHRASRLSGDSESRKKTSELLITKY